MISVRQQRIGLVRTKGRSDPDTPEALGTTHRFLRLRMREPQDTPHKTLRVPTIPRIHSTGLVGSPGVNPAIELIERLQRSGNAPIEPIERLQLPSPVPDKDRRVASKAARLPWFVVSATLIFPTSRTAGTRPGGRSAHGRAG